MIVLVMGKDLCVVVFVAFEDLCVIVLVMGKDLCVVNFVAFEDLCMVAFVAGCLCGGLYLDHLNLRAYIVCT